MSEAEFTFIVRYEYAEAEPVVELPIIEPPNPERGNTKRYRKFERLARVWCRANGYDHSPAVRSYIRSVMARMRSKPNA